MARANRQPKIETLLKRLDAALQRFYPDFYQALAPGVTEEEIEEAERQLGFPLADDFKALYRWKNGLSKVPPDGDTDFPSWYATWGPLQSAVATAVEPSRDIWRPSDRKDLDWADDLPDDWQPEFWWHDKWVPFLWHDTGDLTCLDMNGSFGGQPGQIMEYWHDSWNRVIKYPSITRWIHITATVLANPAFYVDGELDSDSAHNKGYQMNPGYPKFYPPPPEGL